MLNVIVIYSAKKSNTKGPISFWFSSLGWQSQERLEGEAETHVWDEGQRKMQCSQLAPRTVEDPWPLGHGTGAGVSGIRQGFLCIMGRGEDFTLYDIKSQGSAHTGSSSSRQTAVISMPTSHCWHPPSNPRRKNLSLSGKRWLPRRSRARTRSMWAGTASTIWWQFLSGTSFSFEHLTWYISIFKWYVFLFDSWNPHVA